MKSQATHRTNVRRLRTAVAAVAGALWIASAGSTAMAQYRIENGRARDANNRVGDDGRYDLGSSYRRDLRATPNQVVTGNVAGLYGFRGNVGYREASEFRGPVASSNSDSFVRRSSGGYSGYGGSSTGANYPTAFYTRSRTVEPPADYVREGYGLGAYVPNPNGGSGDQTVRYNTTNRGYFDRIGTLPPPNNLILPTPGGAEEGSYIGASPLTGIRQYQAGQAIGNDSFLTGTRDLPRTSRDARLNSDSIQRMRDELRNAAPGTRSPTDGEAPPAEGDASQEKGAAASGQPTGVPIGTPLGAPVGQARDATAQVTQGTRYRFTLPPEQQSEQYAQMRKRLEESNTHGTMTDEQAYRAFQDAKKAGTLDPTAPKPGAPANQVRPGEQDPNVAPGNEPRGTPQPLPSGTTSRPAGESRRPTPIKVDSLAAGVTGKGLSDLLSEAETQMREGKFASAIDRYEAAEQVAPNNPLISLGRANAELGAGYYSRAEAHLREAFSADKALLVGQYNLQNFLGEDRLQVLVKDLKDIANREKTESRPVFLLAYVAYNTGNERMAAGYLDLAEKRGDAKDALYPLIRQHWNLPDEAATDAEVEQPATQPSVAPSAAEEAPATPNK